MTRKLILMLAIALTIFAVSAKAITCSPEPPECSGMDGSKDGSITVNLTGPGGTIACHFNFCYCYKCPTPLDPPNTPIKILVWSIQSVDGCYDIDMGLVYDKVREEILTPPHIMQICGTAPCQPLPTHYKYVEYSTAACWHHVTINNLWYCLPCDGCTAKCIWNYRYCFESGIIYLDLISNTLVGDLNCNEQCPGYGYGPGEDWPPNWGDCYHVCQ